MLTTSETDMQDLLSFQSLSLERRDAFLGLHLDKRSHIKGFNTVSPADKKEPTCSDVELMHTAEMNTLISALTIHRTYMIKACADMRHRVELAACRAARTKRLHRELMEKINTAHTPQDSIIRDSGVDLTDHVKEYDGAQAAAENRAMIHFQDQVLAAFIVIAILYCWAV